MFHFPRNDSTNKLVSGLIGGLIGGNYMASLLVFTTAPCSEGPDIWSVSWLEQAKTPRDSAYNLILIRILKFFLDFCFLFDNPFLSENMSKILIAFPVDVAANILAEKLLVENINNQGRIACISKIYCRIFLGMAGGWLENNPVGQSLCFLYRQILYRGNIFQTTPL